jgi:uncharacterized protein YeaO (DUF488 family)
MTGPRVEIKRAYVAPDRRDGCRVLVDRVWPRGVSKADLKVDLWTRDAAPSVELRKWFGHDPERWDGFRERYFAELDANPQALAVIREKLRQGTVTLVYGARDERHNQAAALREYLQRGGR